MWKKAKFGPLAAVFGCNCGEPNLGATVQHTGMLRHIHIADYCDMGKGILDDDYDVKTPVC